MADDSADGGTTTGSDDMTFDHLMIFADEPTAQADPFVGAYSIGGVGGNWRTDVTIPNIAVYQFAASVRQAFAGWYILIALPALDPNLSSSPACVFVLNRDTNTVAHVPPAAVVTPLQRHLGSWFAGSAYTVIGIDPVATSVAAP